MLKATDEWQEIESPGYPDPGYESGEKCSWLIEAAVGTYQISYFNIFSP